MTRPDRRPGEPLTYAEAGVDIAAGDKAVELIKHHVRSTFRSEVIGDVGGFAGLFSLGRLACEDPVLVASTDGVGTKSLVTRLTGRYDTIGLDVVAMSVDDVAANGAEPLFFLDYLSVGKLVPGTVDEIVAGVADGCRQANCALLGGEMSEHPDAMEPGEFDLVGFAVGVVGRDRLLPAGVRAGDRVLGIASPGLRCNGYSLARRALLDVAGRPLDGPAWDGAEHTLGDELARPSEIYAPALARLRAAVPVHALVHVTGGGIPGNLTRVLPENCDAVVRRGSWPEPRIFAEVQRAGAVPGEEMAHVFNLGLGMLAVVAPDAAASALETLAAAGREAWEVGTVTTGDGRVTVQG